MKAENARVRGECRERAVVMHEACSDRDLKPDGGERAAKLKLTGQKTKQWLCKLSV